MADGPVKDLICFVYWTCLQLERYVLYLLSDIRLS